MEEQNAIRGSYFLMAVALTVILFMCGCRTEYYESGKVKSEGFHLGTQGLGEYYLIKFDAKE